MSILIKGMEMPDFGEKIIVLTSSGYVEDVSGDVIQGVEAISVPTPHGRLIDPDSLEMNYLHIRHDGMKIYTQRAIDNAPTIIPAEEVYAQYTDTAGNMHYCGTHSGEHTIKVEESEK